jgi:hypothetical protein
VAAFLSVVILIVGCGGAAARGTSHSPPSTIGGDPVAVSGVCRSRPRSVCLTRSAGGHTIAVKVGWTIGVDLHAPHSYWSAPAAIGARVLRQAGAVARRAGAVEVAYNAVAPGATSLRATERPICAPRRACPQFIVLWDVHVRVTGR